MTDTKSAQPPTATPPLDYARLLERQRQLARRALLKRRRRKSNQ